MVNATRRSAETPYLHYGHVSRKVILGAFYCQRDTPSDPREDHMSQSAAVVSTLPLTTFPWAQITVLSRMRKRTKLDISNLSLYLFTVKKIQCYV